MTIFEPIYRSTESQDVAVKLETGDDYIAWFPGQQSTGLWYYKRLIVAGDAHVVIPEDSIFYVYDPSTTGDFIDNKMALKKELDIPTNDGYANIYLVGRADEPGEFIESITINGESLKIGMEVYGENELLRINLQNMGVELPDNITTAIYETDLYEEKTDWVTLNNKWRELLINYMDIAGCKGNYKSLQNSLEWFNYGRLVELRECWKHETEDGVKLMDRPLNRWLSDWYSKSLSDIAKSTFMIIRQCSVDLSKKIGTEPPKENYPHKKDDDGKEINEVHEAWHVPVYQPYTYDPKRIHEDDLGEYEIKWAKDEMRMKMTLLGLFFETNFMPVHLDLLRCSVEDIIFDTPYTIRMGGVPEVECICCNTLNEMTIHGYGKDKEPDEDGFDIVLHLDQQSVFGADINKPNGGQNKSLLNFGITNTSDLNILGVTYDNPPTEGISSEVGADNIGLIAASWFNEIGAVAELEIVTPTEVKTGKLITNIIDGTVTRESNIICTTQKYNVDWQGNVLNYDPVYNDADEWVPNQKYYKQILKNQYAIVNQYGLPANDERYTEIKEEWGWVKMPNEDDADYKDFVYDDGVTYYKQTSTATYIIVNGLGQQIDDTRYKTKPPEEWIEWTLDLKYKRELYKTDIKLLCQKPGTFWACLELSGGGYTYSHKFNIKVIDNLDVRLEFFKLIWDPEEKDPFDIENLGPNKSMFTTTRDTDPDIWRDQGWNEWKDKYDNLIGYTIPDKVIDNYKYQQYVTLSTFIGPHSYRQLGDRPRLSWIATVTSKNEGESFDDPSNLLSTYLLDAFYSKKAIYVDPEHPDNSNRLWYVQYTPIDRSCGKADLQDLLQPIKSDHKIFYKQVFIPEYHKMVLIDSMEDIPMEYPIIAVPVIELNINGQRRDLTWSHKFNNPAWKFYSFAKISEVDHLEFNIQQPFIASQYKQPNPIGRYKVSFSYKWGDEVKTVTRMSPFNIIPK